MNAQQFRSDSRVLLNMLRLSRGRTHAERLDSFYKDQAGDYDSFRERLLPGRRELLRRLPCREGANWVDCGGGTGVMVEFLGRRANWLQSYTVVDLCAPLLEQARGRIARLGLQNARAVEADVTTYMPPEGQADVVLFSYSLSMIPDWFAAVDHARRLLKPGGLLAVVDFYVSRRYPDHDLKRHGAFTRRFWPLWFSWDNIHLNQDLLPYLRGRFEQVHLTEGLTRLPYVPLSRVPYFQFIGRNPTPAVTSEIPAEVLPHERRFGQVGRPDTPPPPIAAGH